MTGAAVATEEFERLRRQITRMERGVVAGGGARGLAAVGDVSSGGVSFGHPQVDARFQDGVLPFGVHEVAAQSGAEASPALGFCLMITARTLAQNPRGMGLIIQPSGPAGENGDLYGPGLAALGLPLSRLALVRVRTPAEALRVMDEALRCGAAATVVAEVWDDSQVDLSLTKRFNISSQAQGLMAFLVTREQSGTSAALSRWVVGAATSEGEVESARRRGIRRPRLGRPALDLTLTRNRRGAPGGWPLGQWKVEWDGDGCCFHAPGCGAAHLGPAETLPASLAGPAFDRPDTAVA